ncbi:MAG TPA: RnfABCDGE type electron transport complex subunit D [Candidatus Marinimicrobia bacterium]|mgnify:CR=1 FL=1|nr:RnfABCDGE type electron transport complex subunit D [Candidatus Neomarinimicrobiota bacterium]
MTEKKAAPPKKDPRDKLYKPEGRPLILNASPHNLTSDSVPKIMYTVLLALAPAAICGIIFFGMPALTMMLACASAAVLTEYLLNMAAKKPQTINDGSAALTGLLLAMTLPPTFSIGGAILGSIFAITIGKFVFGGLGCNIFNPALLGRAFLQASFPVEMTTWKLPNLAAADAVTGATPLGLLKFEGISTDYLPMLLGNVGGSIGETSALAILVGGIILLVKKYADWRIPLSYLGTVFLIGGLFWLLNPTQYPDPVFHLLGGGLMLGAFFMATDMVTSPITPLGSWIFGLGAGLIVVLIRLFGGLPEVVMYSILLMNGATPLINRWTKPKIFGELRS